MNRLRVLAFAAALVALPHNGRAFVRTQTAPGSGIDLSWDHRDLVWSLSQPPGTNITPALPFDDALAAILTSFQTWHDVACTDLSFTYQGATDRIDIGYDPNASDNLNLLVFRDSGLCTDPTVVPEDDPCVAAEASDTAACANVYNCWEHDTTFYALTTTTYNTATGILVDADTEYNATPSINRFTTAAAGSPACMSPTDFTATGCIDVDVQNTATHEIGHYLGMAHTLVATATMYATAPDGQTSKRILSPDDINGICSIYPRVTLPDAPAAGSGCSGAEASLPGAIVAGLALLRRRRRF